MEIILAIIWLAGIVGCGDMLIRGLRAEYAEHVQANEFVDVKSKESKMNSHEYARLMQKVCRVFAGAA